MMRTVFAVLAWLLLTAPALGQDMLPTIRESDRGRVWWNGGNEMIVDGTAFFPDAAKVRIGAPWVINETGGGGGLSHDVLCDGSSSMPGCSAGKRIEVVLHTGGMNRQGGGECGLFVTKTGTWGHISDAAQQRIFECTADRFEFKVPVTAPNLQGGEGTVVVGSWMIQSPNGQYRTYMQDDGNLVTYKVMPENWLCATWSIFTGWIASCE